MEETRNGKITKKVYITNESNLTWEVEDTDKIIIPLNENDWSIQFDNELPIQLTLESDFFIPKNTYHRLIKGSEDLVVEIINTTFEPDEYEILGEGKTKKKKKDACYYKVKSRYDVWPSAYASGALVKCRKVGAKNWGNKSNEEIEIGEAKKTDFSKEKEQGLHGWFARQGGSGKSQGWVDCNTCKKDPETGRKKCKACGRKEGEDRSKYPACRPTPSACSSRGKGDNWGKKTNEETEISETLERKRFVVSNIIDFMKESIRPKEFDVELFCEKNGLTFKPNRKITELWEDYNWDDLYDIYDEDYMSKENQTDVEIKDIIFSQKYVDEVDQSYVNEKPVLICVLKNKKYLVDGNHRVIKSFMNDEKTINAYIIYYDDL